MYILVQIGDELSSDDRAKLKQAIEDRLFAIDEIVSNALVGIGVDISIDNDNNAVAWVEAVSLVDE